MRKMMVLAAGLILSIAVPGSAHDYVPGAPQETPILLKGGDLQTMSNGLMERTDILLVDGKIAEIGRNLSAPPDAEIIDVTGKTVYPGLIAVQTQIGLVEISAVRASNDQNEVGDYNPEVIAHTSYNPDSEIIPTVRSNGVTTVQVAPTGGLLRGRSFVVHLDGWTKEDAGVKMEDGLHLSWPSVSVINAWWMSRSADEQREEMAKNRRELRRFFDDAGAYVRAKDAGLLDGTDLRMEAMAPYLRGELPVYVDADDERQIREAVAFGKEFGLEIVILGGAEADRVADLLIREEVPVIVGPIQNLPSRVDDPYDQGYALPARLHEEGVRFAIASPGSWSSRDLVHEAAQAVAFGLPHEEALKAITLYPAEILGIAGDQGSLEVGKSATIVVSEGDILDTLTHRVSAMWIEGRRVDLNDRQKELFRKYREKLVRARQGS